MPVPSAVQEFKEDFTKATNKGHEQRLRTKATNKGYEQKHRTLRAPGCVHPARRVVGTRDSEQSATATRIDGSVTTRGGLFYELEKIALPFAACFSFFPCAGEPAICGAA